MPHSPSGPPPVVRVCHVIHSLGRGGAERVLVDLAAAAPGAGIDMSVMSLMPITADGHAADLANRGVRVASLDLVTRWDPGVGRKLARALAPDPPHLIHAHLKHADIAVANAARRMGIPWVSTLHVIEENVGAVNRFKRRLAARIRREAALTIAVSAAQASWYRSTFPSSSARLEVLANGVAAPEAFDEASRQMVRAELGVGEDRVMAVTLAMMRPGKGHDDLLAAARLIAPEVPVTFVLAGSGPEEERLRRVALGSHLGSDRVVFAGFRADSDRLLAAADLLVHPTHADALPTAVIQALAGGLPVIATDVGGVVEATGPDTGRLVPAGDPAALADAIVDLSDDPDGRRWMGKRARERFDALFEAGAWARRLRTRYDRLLAAGGSGGRC